MSGRIPPSSRAGQRRTKHARISVAHRRDVLKAADLYERFSGHDAEEIGKVNVPAMPRVGLAVGVVDAIMYTTTRDGRIEKYIHKFAVRDKPLFVVSPDGKSLHMIDGRYTFTERGIVDASDKSR